MFHVEQYIAEWFSARNIDISGDQQSKLARYAVMVFETGKQFNITGYKNLEDIAKNLILASLEPVLGLNVPRGTRLVDIGSGAGIPGIPMSLYHRDGEFYLLESNEKKSSFISSVIEALTIPNALSVNARAEDIGHNPDYRESFDFACARAFAGVYITIELGLPLLRTGGFLYIYANTTFSETNPPRDLLSHIESLGAAPCDDTTLRRLNLPRAGYFFEKKIPTPGKYPRRYAVIKREASKCTS